MKKYFKIITTIFIASFFLWRNSNAQEIPTGVPIRLDNILDISRDIGGFLIIAGAVLAVIIVVISGITYLFSGPSPQKAKTARDMLKGGIIGSLILFGAGVIINTIKALATNPFGFFE